MQSTSTSTMRIRLGLLALFVAGLLFGANILLRGPNIDPINDAPGFAQFVTKPVAIPAWLLALAGSVMELFGVLGLYAYVAHARTANNVERWAFLGLVFSLPGIALIAPIFAFLAMAAPTIGMLYLQGNTAVVQVANNFYYSPASLAVLASSVVLYTIGSVLFGIAIWRCGTLPKWSGVLYALHAPLIGFPLTWATELLGGLLLIVSSGWILWRGWRETRHSI